MALEQDGRLGAEALDAQLRLVEAEERDRRLDQLFWDPAHSVAPLDPPSLPAPDPLPPAAAGPPAVPPPLAVLAVLGLQRLRIIVRRTLGL